MYTHTILSIAHRHTYYFKRCCCWKISHLLFVTILTRRVPRVEQELPTLPEHLSSPQFLSGVRVTRSLVLCVCFEDSCLSFCSFGYCGVRPSSIYGFWLPLWYLQTLLLTRRQYNISKLKFTTSQTYWTYK